MNKTALALAALLGLACSPPPLEPGITRKSSGPIVRIKIAESGRILVNGTERTVAQLEPLLASLKKSKGTVWYYREVGDGNQPPEVIQVLKLVVDMGIQMSLSSKPDFSDYIGSDGLRHPRIAEPPPAKP